MIPSLAQAREAGKSSPSGEARPSTRRDRQTTIEAFADDLALTGEQRAEIEGMLDHYRASARELQQAVRPQYRSLMDSIRTQIESVLSDAQVEQYRNLLSERYRERDPATSERENGSDGQDKKKNETPK